jgi:outer membrane receptor protein involved in Fe transport
LIDDYITVAPDTSVPSALPMSFPVVYRHINGDQALFAGGELRLDHRATEHFSWWTSVNYVRAEDTLYDEPAFGIPPLQGQLALRYGRGVRRPWWVEAAGLFVDEQDRVAAIRLEVPTPGYEVYALRGGVHLIETLRLDVAVENLTDREYARHLNSLDPFNGSRIPEIGRYVRAGVTFAF